MKPQQGATLGQHLEQARQQAGLSLRALVAATGIPLGTINRLLKDEIEKPRAEHLVRLAHALELRTADLFLVAGIPLPSELPSIGALLRAEYDLPEEAIKEAQRQIDAIVAQYGGKATREN